LSGNGDLRNSLALKQASPRPRYKSALIKEFGTAVLTKLFNVMTEVREMKKGYLGFILVPALAFGVVACEVEEEQAATGGGAGMQTETAGAETERPEMETEERETAGAPEEDEQVPQEQQAQREPAVQSPRS
jgi:hypothetical protein